MTDIVRIASDLFGSAVAATLTSSVCLGIAKAAFSRAIDQAAKREIEQLKGDLAQQLERSREAFQLELETQRQLASRSLEEFKSELTIASEVRRQVAARRLDAVLDLTKRAEPLQRHFVNIGPMDVDSHARAVEALHDFWRSVGEMSVLFEQDVAREMMDYAAKSWSDAEALRRSDPGALDRLRERHMAFRTLLRAQIGLASEPSTSIVR